MGNGSEHQSRCNVVRHADRQPFRLDPFAIWEQIDLNLREWRCPATIMKNKGIAQEVALSYAAVALLLRVQPIEELRKGLIFTGRQNKPLSDMSLTKVMRQAKRDETVHGFRTSFSSWAGERMPHIPWNVAELAIAHKVGTTVENAYNRADYFAMRRALFEEWDMFIAPLLSDTSDNVSGSGLGRDYAVRRGKWPTIPLGA